MSIVKNINVKINTKNTNINAKMSTNKDVSFDASIDKPDFIYENDYNQMLNKPQINNITLEGNKTPKDLNMTTSQLTNDGDGSSPFATEDYVNENGGKIDSISVNNVNQEIDENKNVNIDLNNYVTFTDYMSSSKSGIAKLGSNLGILTDIDNQLYTVKATENDINAKTDNYKVIVPSNLDDAIKSGLANTKIEWNNEDKANARNTIDAASNTEFESHVNDLNNPHNVTKAQVGLSNVDNTSDLNKPISTLTQQAINNETERATAKENEISQTLQNEMNTRVQEHSEIQEQIDTINSKIPNQASSTNQLADKNFVNSSINSSAAFFKGNFATKAALDAIQWQTSDSSLTTYVSNNDYAYIEADETHNNEAWRYIYVKDDSTSEWQPQFKVNNAPFTAEQLAAINSGATSDLINSISSKLTQDAIVDSTGDSSTKAISQRAATLAAQLVQNNLDTHINNKNNPHSVTKTQIGLSNVDNTSDIDKPISTAVQEEFNNYLPLSGGTLKGDINLSTNRGLSATTTSGDVYDIFRVDSANKKLTIGNSYPALELKGLNERPTYNGSEVALKSDIAESTVVNDGLLNIQLNGSNIGTFTANSATNVTVNIQALPNYSLSISHQTGGNPRQVKFLSVNYSSYTTESSAYLKLGAMSCHGNGASYQFLEDIIIGVAYNPTTDVVTPKCEVYKYVQIESGTVDGLATYFGDIYYVIDSTNKIIDFYILCGQYASSQFTPFTKIGSTTTSGITQYSGTATYYSSGTKVWATGNGTTYARLSDITNKALTIDGSNTMTGNLNLRASGANETNIGPNGIRWGTDSLPQDNAPQYICTIDSFANGGRQKWASVSDLGNSIGAIKLEYDSGYVAFSSGITTTTLATSHPFYAMGFRKKLSIPAKTLTDAGVWVGWTNPNIDLTKFSNSNKKYFCMIDINIQPSSASAVEIPYSSTFTPFSFTETSGNVSGGISGAYVWGGTSDTDLRYLSVMMISGSTNPNVEFFISETSSYSFKYFKFRFRVFTYPTG